MDPNKTYIRNYNVMSWGVSSLIIYPKQLLGMEDIFWHDCIFGKQVWEYLQNETKHAQIAWPVLVINRYI